jgi:hypothetical protein
MAIQNAVATETLNALGGQGLAGMLNALITAVEGSGGGHTHLLAVGATDVTASVDEVNVLDGIPATLTATELGYCDGVTSAIQTQLETKALGSDLTTHISDTTTHGTTGDIVGTTDTQNMSGKTFIDDIFLANGKNIQYNSADPSRTIWASSWKPTTTAGCASSTTIEAGTNDIDYDVLDFDKATDEHAFINWQMPDSWGGGTLLFRVIWTAAAGGAADTLNMVLKGRAYANDDAIDQAAGTGVAVADTWIADGDIHITAWSSAVTLAGTPAGGQLVHLDLMRDVSEDDLDCDARIIGVQVKYVQTTYAD